MSLLISCSQVISSCPQLVEYSLEEQRQQAFEIVSLKITDDTMTGRFLSDYSGLRDQVRACQN